MPRTLTVAGLLLAAAAIAATVLAIPDPSPLKVGDVAPAFALTGATRDGVLPRPVRLSDFRDQTIVIAFFYKARTSG